MNLQKLADLPAYQLASELQERYGHLLNIPVQARLSAIVGQMEQYQRLYATIPPHFRNPEYFERLAELLQCLIELDSELKEKENEVEPTVLKWRLAVNERYKIDVLPVIREFVQWAYSDTDIEDLRCIFPDEVAKDLIRFAKENGPDFDRLVNEVESFSKEVAEPIPTSTPKKIPIKALALAYHYLQRSKEVPQFYPIKASAYEVAREHGIKAGNEFYQAWLAVDVEKTRHSLAYQQHRNHVRDYLARYPKALLLFDNEVINK